MITLKLREKMYCFILFQDLKRTIFCLKFESAFVQWSLNWGDQTLHMVILEGFQKNSALFGFCRHIMTPSQRRSLFGNPVLYVSNPGIPPARFPYHRWKSFNRHSTWLHFNNFTLAAGFLNIIYI